MLTGRFENCYGIKEFDMGIGINFARSNKALIYAPNGVMKTSFAKVFEDLSKGQAPKDRIFSTSITSYSIQYYASTFVYTSVNPKVVPNCDSVYVVNSFTDKFEFTKETVNTLLADEATRNEYNVLIAQFVEQVKKLEAELSLKSGVSKLRIKNVLLSDLQLPSTADWPDIIEAINTLIEEDEPVSYLNEIKYSVLFHEKAVAVYAKSDFKKYVKQYIERLGDLLQNSGLLNKDFTDRSVETLTKTFSSNNLFSAQHKIILKDGTEIQTLEEWKKVVDEQIKRMYTDETLHTAFERLKKLLTANNDVDAARRLIIDYQQIIPLLFEISKTKRRMWASYCSQLERSFDEYYKEIVAFTDRVRELYEKAAAQSERWNQVVNEFNRRFRVPFTVQINNKSNFILKDEAPNLTFLYKRGSGEQEESQDMTKDMLLPSLSMGEKRAMYLLYILFDLERIRIQAAAGQKHLIVTDDIADSFDYKNKYAIIEYLSDLAKNSGIDLLMLTHNFDFYRTVKLRLNVIRDNCYIAQKDDAGRIQLAVFRYQKDFFKNVIIAGIKGKNPIEQQRMLIASIPFYRNLAEYSGEEVDYLRLTCFLHFKTGPVDTSSATLMDLWNIICQYIKDSSISFGKESFFDMVQQFAKNVISNPDEISLENKLIISIATRLLAEKWLKCVIINNVGYCEDSTKNQLREWYEIAKPYLFDEQKAIMDEVNLITPEAIHLNAFMYEPLIDISIWALKDIYTKVGTLADVP